MFLNYLFYVFFCMFCVLCFGIVFCIVSPHMYGCLFPICVQLYQPLPLGATQLQLINIISYISYCTEMVDSNLPKFVVLFRGH